MRRILCKELEANEQTFATKSIKKLRFSLRIRSVASARDSCEEWMWDGVGKRKLPTPGTIPNKNR